MSSTQQIQLIMFLNLRNIYLALILLFSVGCSSIEEEFRIVPFSVSYNSSLNYLQQEDYSSANTHISLALQQHPFSKEAANAQLLLAFIDFKSEKYDIAAYELDRFIETFPASKYLDYALYLKGMIYYFQISIIERDANVTAEAKKVFIRLINTFPNSKYTESAKYKIDLLDNLLAAKEMDVGRFYLNNGNIVSAINRFKNVVEFYPRSEQVPEALFRMIEGYASIGLVEEASEVGYQLGYNYVDSKWYKLGFEIIQNYINNKG